MAGNFLAAQDTILHRLNPNDFLLTGIPGWTGPVSGGPISGGTGSIPSSGYLVTVCTKRDEFPQFIGRELSRCSRYDPNDFLLTGIPGWMGPVSGGPISGGTGDSQSSGYLVTVCTKRDKFPHYIGRELSRCSRYDPNDFLLTGIPGWTGPVSGGPISGGTGDIPSPGYLVTICTKRDEFPQYIDRELSRCSRYIRYCTGMTQMIF